MGSESNSATAPTPSPSGKRSRDPEDEVYVDNLHSHKRYLSEVCISIRILNAISIQADFIYPIRGDRRVLCISDFGHI